ncbi:MAG: prepilin-type N-terminal cleavage/methylation domain-containing protein [Paracoccaceae bacterium]
MTSRGFTLLEVVLALAILAGGTVMAQQAIGRAALGLRGSEARETSVLLGQGLLAEIRARRALAPGADASQAGSAPRWRREIRRVRPIEGTRLALWRITVTVSPERGTPLRLETLQIAEAAE